MFVFNWNPTQSFSDYRIGCKEETKYKLVLSSDNAEFGGYSNLSTETAGEYHAEDYAFNGRPASFLAYLPSRTVSVRRQWISPRNSSASPRLMWRNKRITQFTQFNYSSSDLAVCCIIAHAHTRDNFNDYK